MTRIFIAATFWITFALLVVAAAPLVAKGDTTATLVGLLGAMLAGHHWHAEEHHK